MALRARHASLVPRAWLPAFLVLALAWAADGALTTSGPSCSTQMPPQNLPLPTCPPSNATLEDARKIAWKVAPTVHFHPLEPWYLQSPDVYYNAAQLFMPDFMPPGDSHFDFIFSNKQLEAMWLPRTFVTLMKSDKVTPAERDAVLAGAPFNASGFSQAKVFYTVQDLDEGTWLFNFNLFYSWNGCSNQAFALSMNGTTEVLEYLMCPPGVHEADLERISMLVCKEDRGIKQLAYSQHAWMEVRDCEKDRQCYFDDDGHPIAYAGLQGHGNYFDSSPLDVYEFFNGSVGGGAAELLNFGGIWLGDRTLADPNRRFVPDPSNIVYIPPAEEIEEKNLTEFEWAMYPGNWGAGKFLLLPLPNLTCLYDNQTREGPCEDSQATEILAAAINVMRLKPEQYEGPEYSLQNSTNSTVPWPDITGPLYRAFTYVWMPERGAPITSRNGTLTCPEDVVGLAPIPGLSNFANGVDTLISYLVGICLGAFLFSVIMALIFMMPMLLREAGTIHLRMKRGLSKIKMAGGKASETVKGVSHSAMSAMSGSGWRRPKPDSGSQLGEAVALPAAAAGSAAELAAAGPAEAEAEVADPAPLAAAPAPVPAAAGDSGAAVPVKEGGGEEPREGASEGADAEGRPEVSEDFVLRGRQALWLALAIGLFIAGIILVAIGAEKFWTNSVAAVALDQSGSSVLQALRILLIVGLSLIGLIDLIAFTIIFIGTPQSIRIGGWRFHNYFGRSKWINKHSFNIHIGVIGCMILAINLSAILFALGLLIVVTQVAVRTACTSISNIDVLGITVAEVCVDIPSLSAEPTCGWEALQWCYEMTNMTVILIVLGSAFLLWCHLVWLLMLMLSLWRFYDFSIEY